LNPQQQQQVSDEAGSIPILQQEAQIKSAKIECMVKEFKTQHFAMDFDSAFIKLVMVKKRGEV
jgi:hypothetical protein